MDQKLRILMQRENLTASRLAEILEIKPAAVSHILSGRNKPGYELICKIINRFPQINPYWLLGDAEEIDNQNAPISTSATLLPSTGNLFTPTEESEPNPNQQVQPLASALTRSDIAKIIVVYNDQTFEELKPKKM